MEGRGREGGKGERGGEERKEGGEESEGERERKGGKDREWGGRNREKEGSIDCLPSFHSWKLVSGV